MFFPKQENLIKKDHLLLHIVDYFTRNKEFILKNQYFTKGEAHKAKNRKKTPKKLMKIRTEQHID